MQITDIAIYQVDLPIKEGSYDWSGGQSFDAFDSTIVRLETLDDIVGWGETTTLGSAYLPAYARGVRAGIEELAPTILGADPTKPAVLNTRMDQQLRGHPYVKSAIDVACWDILGKVTGEPVMTLLGGDFEGGVPLYRAISQADPATMADRVAKFREQGYRTFQLKTGVDPQSDAARIRTSRRRLEPGDTLIADANTGLTQHEAIRLAKAVDDIDVYLEQPCANYGACLAVRQHTNLPFILDESIDGIDALMRAHRDAAMDVVNLKISKVGGLTKARQLRDLCVDLELAMIIEDTWASEIGTTAMVHLAQSTPPAYRFASTDFHHYNDITTAEGAPRVSGDTMSVGTAPGLGITPDREVLGEPIARFA